MTHDSSPAFLIGRPSSEYLEVSVPARSYPNVDDYWDGNWLAGRVRLGVGAFRGSFRCYLRTTDFPDFRDRLATLHESLEGTARFSTMEEQVEIEITGDGRGHFSARCVVVDQAGIGNKLTFSLDFDQTDLPAILRGLDGIIVAYPTKGSPDGG